MTSTHQGQTETQQSTSPLKSESRHVEKKMSDIISQTQRLNINTIDQKGDEKSDSNNPLANLIVNYLPPTMNEDNLKMIFSSCGQLESVKIVMDLQTGKSRGYGFIKFSNPESAQRAIDELNGYDISGKKIKVSYARPQSKEIQNSNLYVTNLPLPVDETKLLNLFKDFGNIIECRVLKGKDPTMKGVAFVRMDTHMNAVRAVENRDNYVLDGQPIHVKISQHPTVKNNRTWTNNNDRQNNPYNTNTNRYGNRGSFNRMNNNSQHQQVTSGFEPFVGHSGSGEFFSKNMSGNNSNDSPRMRNFRGQNYRGNQYRQRGSGRPNTQNQFVPNTGVTGMYGMYDTAFQRATPQVPQYFQQDPTAIRAPTVPTGPNTTIPQQYNNANPISQTFNIVVYNIPSEYSVDHLIQIFAPFGPIHSVNIVPNSPKGSYGIISYFFFDDAQRAQNETNGRRVENQLLEVHLQSK